ncbi:MAG: alpha/beta fold hydrolase [Lachnospiraceae bacterium]|nr:alpha/beta fold hydrolase [Lachnospiraceae bacterium]
MTKIIYDGIFKRYDVETEVPDALRQLVDLRESVTFYSGDNELKGYLYSAAVIPNNKQDKGTISITDGSNDDLSYPMISGTPLVVIVPGFHAESDDYLWQVQSLLDYEYDVFIFDATGSGESGGKSYIGFSQELFDLDAALSYIEATYNYENIFLLGHSRGGYAACGMLDSEHEITAVVSVSGINSAMEAVIGSAENYVGPLAYGNYPLLWLYQVSLFDEDTVSLQADDCISNSEVPTLVVQGNEDDTAPMDAGSIYSHKDEITSDHVEYYVCDVPGQNGHTDLLFDSDGTANDVLMETIDTFFNDQLQ